MIYTSHYESPLGTILLAGDEEGLTGYGGGILRKKALLELEGVDMSRFAIPAKGTAL